jgi:hypothetical protein
MFLDGLRKDHDKLGSDCRRAGRQNVHNVKQWDRREAMKNEHAKKICFLLNLKTGFPII